MDTDRAMDITADGPTTAEALTNRTFKLSTRAKEKRSADELAAIILQDLSNVDGCPKRGVTVTVYGINPWNVMLTFGVEAGPVRNKAELQRFCDILTNRLRGLYDVGP